MTSQAVGVRSLKGRLARMYQVASIRRAAVLAICVVAAYAVWAAVRWQPIPGTVDPLWTLPLVLKAGLLAAMAAAFFGLFRLGGRLIRDARRLYVSTTGVRSSDAGVRWYRYLNPVGPFYNMYLHRDLLRQFVRREVEGRYRGSALGLVWSILTPLLMLAVYTFVFSVILKARWQGGSQASEGEFAVTLFAGLIAFTLFSEVVNRSPSLIVSHPNYVKKVVFPLEVLPATALGAAVFHGLVNVGILLAANLVIAHTVSTTVVLLPVVALPLLGLTLGVGWFLASLGAYVRDVAYLVGFLTQVLFFLSAIFYPVEAVPESVQPLFYLNPLTTIVESFRQVLIWNQVPDWGAWLAATLVAGAALLLGYTWFMKTKTGFADVI